MLRSNHNTWKLTVDTLDLPPPHTLKSTQVCCTLLLAAVFYRAIYSRMSCLICFVWRKVNLEIETNWRHFEWSQADGSTTAELYILLAHCAAVCCHALLSTASHSYTSISHPDISRHGLVLTPLPSQSAIYVSVFQCPQSPSFVLISNWKNPIVLAPSRAAVCLACPRVAVEEMRLELQIRRRA